jgi:hypothetical protein
MILAHAAGYLADHVNYLGLGGLRDWQLLPVTAKGTTRL